MTRKRYIKLLMGKLELSRNEARDRAARIVSIKNELDEVLKNEHLLSNYVQDSTSHVEYVESLRNNLYKYKFNF